MSEQVLDRDVTVPDARRGVMADGGARLAAYVFGGAAVFAFFMYLFLGRHVWFWLDEFDFLAARSLNAHDVFASHGGHLVALPVVVYRALYAVFGLRTYLPYQILSVAAHVVSALLLRVIMRRAGVGPWIATVAAGLFLFFGTGGQDIIYAFQITFGGSLVFGLGQLVLSDHEGPVDRRDWFGLACGLAALLCSGVAITMVIVVGMVALARRGWRVAALHTAPLAAVYAGWLLFGDRQGFPATTHNGLLRWDQRGISATFHALGHVDFMGWVLGALLVTGLILVWKQRHGFELLRTEAVLPIAMLAGAFIFLTIAGIGRAGIGIGFAASGRYMHIVAALVLPAIALAADAVVRAFHGSRVVIGIVIVLLLVGIPGNVDATSRSAGARGFFTASKRLVRALPYLDIATRVPGGDHPDPNGAPDLTIGWLVGARRAGHLPGPIVLSAKQRATYTLMLALNESHGTVDAPCVPLTTPVERVLQQGESVSVRGSVFVRGGFPVGVAGGPIAYGDSFFSGFGSHRLTAEAGPLNLEFAPLSKAGANSAFVCGGSPPNAP